MLVHGGVTLYETAAISRYVDEAFDGPALQPPSPLGRARMVQVISLLDAYAFDPLAKGVFHERIIEPILGHSPDLQRIAALLPAVETVLDALAALQRGAPFLVGESLTLADLHAFAMIKYLALTEEGQAQLARRPSLQQWLTRIDQRPSVQRTRSPFERGERGANHVSQ